MSFTCHIVNLLIALNGLYRNSLFCIKVMWRFALNKKWGYDWADGELQVIKK